MFAGQPNHAGRARHWVWLVFLSAVAWAQPAPAKPERKVVDRIVAAVNGQAITLSQLDFETRVLFVWKGGVRAAFAQLDREALAVGLKEIIGDTIAVAEADRIEAYALDEGELEAALDKLRAALGDQELRDFLDRHEARLDDVAAVLKRRLRATKVWDGRLRLKARVTDAEVKRFQAEHAEAQSASAEAVRKFLYDQRYEQLKEGELRQARRQHDVRLLGGFETPAPERTAP